MEQWLGQQGLTARAALHAGLRPPSGLEGVPEAHAQADWGLMLWERGQAATALAVAEARGDHAAAAEERARLADLEQQLAQDTKLYGPPPWDPGAELPSDGAAG
jgi:hypothetical protein